MWTKYRRLKWLNNFIRVHRQYAVKNIFCVSGKISVVISLLPWLQRIFEGSFAPLLPSKVDCLLWTFTCHAFHTMHVRTMPNDRVWRFKMLSVRIVMARPSSATVVSDVLVLEFFEKNAEVKKAKCRSWSKELSKGLRTCMTIYWKCIHCVTKKMSQRKSRAGSSDQFFFRPDSVVKHSQEGSLAAVWRFEDLKGFHGEDYKVNFNLHCSPNYFSL